LLCPVLENLPGFRFIIIQFPTLWLQKIEKDNRFERAVEFTPALEFTFAIKHRGLISQYSVGKGIVAALGIHIIDKPDGEQFQISHRKP